MLKDDEVGLAYRAAEMYYIKQMNQDEIAKELEVSRSKISRLLSSARELGMVRIELVSPESFNFSVLEKDLAEEYHLREVHIAASVKGSEQEMKKRISLIFQKHLLRLLEGKRAVGLGWGTTVYEAVSSLPADMAKLQNMRITPLLGGLDQSEKTYQINNMVEKLANSLGAVPMFLSSPAIFNNPEQLRVMKQVQVVSNIIREWEHLEAAIFGLGGPVGMSAVLDSNLPASLILELVRKHAVGDIVARFFNFAGELVCRDIEEVLLGIPFEQLLKIPERICLSGGEHKVDGIRAALKSGFITTLFTDIRTARMLATQ
jgi:deoxyribonucleoside regulator